MNFVFLKTYQYPVISWVKNDYIVYVHKKFNTNFINFSFSRIKCQPCQNVLINLFQQQQKEVKAKGCLHSTM